MAAKTSQQKAPKQIEQKPKKGAQKPNDPSESNSQLTAYVLVAGLSLSLAIVASITLIDTINFRRRVLSEKNTALERIEANEVVFESIDERSEQLSGEVYNPDNILLALPAHQDFNEGAELVNNIATRSGVELTSIGFDDTTSVIVSDPRVETSAAGENILSYRVFIDVEAGDYDLLKNFIQNLRDSRRAISILSVDLEGSSSGIEMQSVLELYYQPRVSLDIETKEVR